MSLPDELRVVAQRHERAINPEGRERLLATFDLHERARGDPHERAEVVVNRGDGVVALLLRAAEHHETRGNKRHSHTHDRRTRTAEATGRSAGAQQGEREG